VVSKKKNPSNLPVPTASESEKRLRAGAMMQSTTLHILHSVALTTGEGEAIKAGEIRNICTKANVPFRPMSIECPLLVAQRFHLEYLQVGNKAVSMRFASMGNGSPVAMWTLYEAPSLLPGGAIELIIKNINSAPHYFAATLVGASPVGP
jgi:hypothetical protein